MKKLFLVGALAASMALSSSAFAAVSYGDADTLKVAYDGADKVSVTTDLSTYNGQMTVLVLNNDDGTVVAEDIMYIDQAASGTGIFQNMGLLMPDGATTLPVGTYTVKVGSDDAALTSLLVGTIKVTADETGKKVSFVFGDVTGDDAANTDDAVAIMAKLVGGAADVGGIYLIGQEVALKDGSVHAFGDVTGDDAANTDDAVAIMAKLVGGAADVGGLYAIGDDAELIVNE